MLNVLYLGKCQNAKSVMSGTMTNILHWFFLGRCQICGFWNSRAYDPVISGQIIRFMGRILYSGLIQMCNTVMCLVLKLDTFAVQPKTD